MKLPVPMGRIVPGKAQGRSLPLEPQDDAEELGNEWHFGEFHNGAVGVVKRDDAR